MRDPARAGTADRASRFRRQLSRRRRWPRSRSNPGALIAAHRAARRGNALGIVGWFHTHPGGTTEPSPRDAAAAAPDGSIWIIANGRAARMWRAVPDGAVHGRFDPVKFDILRGKRVENGVDVVHLR